MMYYKEESIMNFQFWAGGAQNAKIFKENGDLNKLEEAVKETFIELLPSETTINELFWFEADYLARYLGYEDFEDYINRRAEK